MQPGIPLLWGVRAIEEHDRRKARTRRFQVAEHCQVSADPFLREVKPEDLDQFGLIPEITGRLSLFR
jgi:ATP-dependent protease Clp ATPase subunit